MEAYDAYLVGRAFVNARTPGWGDNAIAAFEKAIRLDENYAPPYAGLAVALNINNADWEAVRESIVRAAETAIELDPELAEGHAALGLTLLNHAVLLGDTQNEFERAEQSLRWALELDPSLSIAFSWLASTLLEQGRYEEAYAVREQGLLIDPLNPVMSMNLADRLKKLGERERERAEQLILRLTHLPDPAGIALFGLVRLYGDTGEFDKALHWVKEYTLAYIEYPGATISIAAIYERLGLHKDADYWMAIALAHTPQPARRFNYRAWQFWVRGDSAGVRTEIDKLRSVLGTDIDGLQGGYAAVYAVGNIDVENYDLGIDVFEKTFDFESLSTLQHPVVFRQGLEFSHVLAYAYQQVGRDDEAHVLLTRVHEQLNVLVVEQNMDYGPLHLLFAQNFGLRGDFDAAADAFQSAIKAGWLRYLWVVNDPTWAKTIADPRIARMLDEVKVELERQRAVVEQADAEHDFRAEFAAMRSTTRE
jgi:tetratricopeptide (TPR) repeat protein